MATPRAAKINAMSPGPAWGRAASDTTAAFGEGAGDSESLPVVVVVVVVDLDCYTCTRHRKNARVAASVTQPSLFKSSFLNSV